MPSKLVELNLWSRSRSWDTAIFIARVLMICFSRSRTTHRRAWSGAHYALRHAPIQWVHGGVQNVRTVWICRGGEGIVYQHRPYRSGTSTAPPRHWYQKRRFRCAEKEELQTRRRSCGCDCTTSVEIPLEHPKPERLRSWVHVNYNGRCTVMSASRRWASAPAYEPLITVF